MRTTCLRASVAEDDVVDWDEDELDHVADEAHDEEPNDASLQDLHVLWELGAYLSCLAWHTC